MIKGFSKLVLFLAVFLCTACDKLPFLKKESVDKKPKPSDANPAAAPAAEPKKQITADETRELAEGEYILYREGSELPVGTVAITSSTESNKTEGTAKLIEKNQDQPYTLFGKTETETKLTVIGKHEHQIEYIKDIELKSANPFNLKSVPEEVKKPLHGETLILLRKEGTWKASMKSGKPTYEQALEIRRIGRSYNEPEESLILGTKPRKVGDQWEVSADNITALNDPEMYISPKGKFSVRFLKTEEHNGFLYAVIETEGSFNGDAIDQAAKKKSGVGLVIGNTQTKAKETIYVSLTHGRVLAKSLTGTHKVSTQSVMNGVKAAVEAVAEISSRSSTVLELPEKKNDQPEVDE